MNPSSKPQPFGLSILGGVTERRFNGMREKLDFRWGSLEATELSDELREDAQVVWTQIAFTEYRSAAAMTAVAETLIMARAPLDLTALATSFAYDELSHAEMCARVLGELGGSVAMLHRPKDLIVAKPPMSIHPLLRAADIVVRVFCVAESFSLPMAQHTARDNAEVPLISDVLQRIAKDEASHAGFGWTFLDWADTWLTAADRKYLSKVATDQVAIYRRLVRDRGNADAPTLGWMTDRAFKARGEQAIKDDVIRPLKMRGIKVSSA